MSPQFEEAPPARPESDHTPPATRWLSRPLEDWLHEQGAQPQVDVLIVGSGYGGAAAAHALAGQCDERGRPLRVVVLERGREYLAGAFPSRFAELPGHIRYAGPAASAPTGRREALFDFRLGPDVCVALANGLGGGSLINAGVLERAADAVFSMPGWPAALGREPMAPWYEQAETLLGVRDARGRNTIDRLQGYQPLRWQALQRLGGLETEPVAISVALDAEPRGAAQLPLSACLACGDCATGCNHEAKQSLDSNLLLQAWRQGAELVCGASVEDLAQIPGQGWRVRVQYTDELLRRRQGQSFEIVARRVVLAAGSLGSTEILLRSQRRGLALSPLLGQRFSGNGDVLAVGVQLPQPVRAVADEAQAPAARGVGPTITAMLREPGDDHVVQDLAIPGPMRPLFEQSFATAATLESLGRFNRGEHQTRADFDDPFALSEARTQAMLPVAIIGHDSGSGRLVLAEDSEESGTLGVDWPGLKHEPAVAQRHAALERRLQAHGAQLLRNPMWQLLPPAMAFLLSGARGPMLSVHPLGGCAMGDSGASGVVNAWGQVFCGLGDVVHEDLVVLDGAILPGSLAINPALTITAVALRALAALRLQWRLQPAAQALRREGPRPRFRAAAPIQERPTEIEVRERLGGFVRWPGAPGGELKYLELSFVYQPKPLKDLLRPGEQRVLQAGPGSRLRIFDTRPDPDAAGRPMLVSADAAALKLWRHAEWSDAQARLSLPIEGELRLFQREPSGALRRGLRAGWAWFMNRGWRDSMHGLIDWAAQRGAPRRPGDPDDGVKARAWNLLQLTTHAGEVRLMDYRVRLAPPAADEPAAALPGWAAGLRGQVLQGRKRITYNRRANPWTQLSRIELTPVAGLQPAPGQTALTLELDLHHLARERMPLMRLRQAQDAPTAIRDVAGLMAYLLRMNLGLHTWTLRKPDDAPWREIRRLPEQVPGLPEPEVLELAAGRWGEAGAQRQPLDRPPREDDDRPVLVRLTRYARPGGTPLLMIHGYSASGTTFAHHSVQPGPAKILWEAGYDIWIVDMRTSAGLPTAKLPWTFEEAAFNDIPLAVDAVLRETGADQLVVFAHCMGSVMLHMALLEPRQQPWEHFYPLRQQLAARIARLVISQVTPMMVMSPTNSLRGVLMQYLRPYLPLQDYAFRPEGLPGLMDQVMDRLLASLPYPDAEFDLENPPFPSLRKTPWVATRHRMDLLYGRDFAISNVDRPVFDFIDDHFGPLNMDTVAQALHFARCHEITDWQGASTYLDSLAKSLALLQAFPVLSLHGLENGLCSAESAELLADHYQQAAPGRYRYQIIAGHGHQDCLIGRHIATHVFPHVLRFLREDIPLPDSGRPLPAGLLLNAQPPWHRLERGAPEGDQLPLLGALAPELGWPGWVISLPMRWLGGDRYERLPGELLLQPFTPPQRGQPGEPWRFGLPLACFPAVSEAAQAGEVSEVGRLVLALYLEPHALSLEGGHSGQMHALSEAELQAQAEQAVQDVLAQPAHRWARGFVASPGLDDAAGEGGLSLVLAACQYPPGLLDASPGWETDAGQAAPALASLARLHAFTRHHPDGAQVSLLLLAGDEIYADASGGLADSRSGLERYGQGYQQFKAGPVRQLPPSLARIVHAPDDHEIIDNWEPDASGPGPWLEAARQAAWDHRWEAGARVGGPQTLWHDFVWRGAAFFVADARCEREHRHVGNWAQARLWSEVQRDAFAQWLARSAGRPRFVLCGSLPLPRRRSSAEHAASALRSDAWDGYPHSQAELLGEIWRQRAQGLVLLSGDEHRSGWISAELEAVESPDETVRLHSIHSSALYAPWPFAVTAKEELAAPEVFEFEGPEGQRLRCRVGAWQDHPGDGFALLRVRGGELQLWFDRAEAPLGPLRAATAAAAASAPTESAALPAPQARLALG